MFAAGAARPAPARSLRRHPPTPEPLAALATKRGAAWEKLADVAECFQPLDDFIAPPGPFDPERVRSAADLIGHDSIDPIQAKSPATIAKKVERCASGLRFAVKSSTISASASALQGVCYLTSFEVMSIVIMKPFVPLNSNGFDPAR